MIKHFKDEFHLMLREQIGYYPWLNHHPYRVNRLLRQNKRCWCCMEQEMRNANHYIREMLEEQVCTNKLLDLLFKALIRSEIRFIHRFIPQRSHEERLTGHLISEMSNSIELIKDLFRLASVEEYGVEKEIDFFYLDMSKGGKLESHTGADLAICFSLDLPDYPKTYKSFVFQAKKMDFISQLDVAQYDKLVNNFPDNSAYLFYDTNCKTLNCPFVLAANVSPISENAEKAEEKLQKSFSIDINDMYSGSPLSYFIIFELLENFEKGETHRSLSSLVNSFRNSNIDFDGRLAIFSIGHSINYSINNDGGLQFDDKEVSNR